MDYTKLTKKYGSPLYLYDFDKIKLKYSILKDAFKGRKSLMCYALKANSNLSVLKHLASLGAGCDSVSIGEIKRALLVGVPPYRIIFSGVGKSDDEIKSAIELDILMINVESLEEFERVDLIAKQLNKVARISVRVNPNIDAKTHPYISTGLRQNKFGVDIHEAKNIYIKAKNSSFIEPVGIHFHVGSQLTDLKPIEDAAKIVVDLIKQLSAIDIDIKFFDVGGGLGITYENEKTIDPYEYAQAILAQMSGLDATILCEPGRFLVGDSGVLVTTVLYEKKNEFKRFVVVDGAMNDLIRPSLYQAYHEVELVGGKGEKSKADVVGPICESADFLAKDRLLPNTKHGDILLVKNAGAYGFSMSSNYNSRPRIAEVAVENGEYRLIKRKESFEDMIALERECL